jgi:magnesium-transporting ATPase (P-type)
MTFVKGAPERILAMCHTVQTVDGKQPIDPSYWEKQIQMLAAQGNRLIALAAFEEPLDSQNLGMHHIQAGGTLLG